VTVSLLVSNSERAFFGKADVVQQNEELQRLITQQSLALKLLRGRLALFTKHQRSTAGESVRGYLSDGDIPRPMGGAAPTRARELKVKAKVLSAELASLVGVRRGLVQERIKAKMKLRRHRLKIKLSVKIQKVMRGFLVRLHLKKMRAAAVVIQRMWRGYLVRNKQEQAFIDFDDIPDVESVHGKEKRRTLKKRVDTEGKEQEYYDYEYEDAEVGSAVEVEEGDAHEPELQTDAPSEASGEDA
jgi:hypothetical protein